ncbi:MAG: thioredoxin family protein, partial [Planctomycetota bacterium]
MLTSNIFIGGLVGLLVAMAIRGAVVLIRRRPLPPGAPGYGGAGLIGLLAGIVLTLYVFPGGSWSESMARMEPVEDLPALQTMLKESDKPVMVYAYSSTCPPCRMLTPRLGELAQRYREQVKFVKVNGSAAPEILSAYHIRGYPTVLLFAPGQTSPGSFWLGVQDTQEYADEIEAVLTEDRSG